MSQKKAVILISGGLDSATTLAIAKSQNYACYALSFNYGQRSFSEINAAKQITTHFEVLEHKFIQLDLREIGGSALTDDNINVPIQGVMSNIPVTYVPARNTIFLSLALGWAEVLGATDIFIGINAVDYSGYPDCRPDFIKAFTQLANVATKAGVEGQQFKIHTPLIDLTKGQIIERGLKLGMDYSLTVSCYQANEQGLACGVCDSCRLRKQGFEQASMIDPTRYQS